MKSSISQSSIKSGKTDEELHSIIKDIELNLQILEKKVENEHLPEKAYEFYKPFMDGMRLNSKYSLYHDFFLNLCRMVLLYSAMFLPNK